MSRALRCGLGRGRHRARRNRHVEPVAIDDDGDCPVLGNEEIMSRQFVANAVLERGIVAFEQADDPFGRIGLEAFELRVVNLFGLTVFYGWIAYARFVRPIAEI
jgi:hypothetical protein